MLVARDLLSTSPADIQLRVERYHRIDVGGLAAKAYCTDVEGTQVSFTAFKNSDWADFEFEEGEWYEFSNVSAEAYEHEIGIKPNWGDEDITKLSEPPTTQDHPGPSADAPVIQLGASEGHVAFDIEIRWTVPPAQRDMQNLEKDDYEIAAIGVGAKPPGAEEPDVKSCLRSGLSPEDELQCIEEAVTWLSEYEASTILTYNGGHFDYPRLLERAEHAHQEADADEVRLDRIRDVLTSYYHADLSKASDRDFGWASLEDVSEEVGHPVPPTHWDEYDHGLNPTEWRQGWDELPDGMEEISSRRFFGRDFPEVAEHYLQSRDTEEETDHLVELEDCLDSYSTADVEPLFSIAEDDRVTDYGAPRVSLVE